MQKLWNNEISELIMIDANQLLSLDCGISSKLIFLWMQSSREMEPKQFVLTTE